MDHSNGLCASGRLAGQDGVEATADSEIILAVVRGSCTRTKNKNLGSCEF